MLCVLSEGDYSCCIVGQMPCLQPYMAWTCSYIALYSLVRRFNLNTLPPHTLRTVYFAKLYSLTSNGWCFGKRLWFKHSIIHPEEDCEGMTRSAFNESCRRHFHVSKSLPIPSVYKYFTVIFLFLQIAISFTASLFTIPTKKKRVLFKCYSNFALYIPTTYKVL